MEKNTSSYFNKAFYVSRLTHLDAVIAFFVYNGNVAPTHATHDINHCFYLVMIGWYSAGKVFEALFIAELGTG